MPVSPARLVVLLALAVAGCGTTSGIIPIGPDVYTLSEMRAPALGGGGEAQRVALAEATGFCQQQGRAFEPLDMRPDGDPRTPYYPTAFDVTFHCAPPGAPPVLSSAPRPSIPKTQGTQP